MATDTRTDVERAARLFHALSDERRLRIIELLRGGERCVCDMVDVLDAGQSLLSFHLKTLKAAGLVSDRKQGRWSYYRLNADPFEEVQEIAATLRADAERTAHSTCCG
ncbi:MAG: metalloregulator ArsR/SmtB family transcription factor [Gemmatimonadetes bacterium]|nr:metalloregulator ArsR/SmtB family transcription factor [Gemmatimonadota bacterium]